MVLLHVKHQIKPENYHELLYSKHHFVACFDNDNKFLNLEQIKIKILES